MGEAGIRNYNHFIALSPIGAGDVELSSRVIQQFMDVAVGGALIKFGGPKIGDPYYFINNRINEV